MRAPALVLVLTLLAAHWSADAVARDKDERRGADREEREDRDGPRGELRAPDAFMDRRGRMTPALAAREAQMRYGGGRVLRVDPAGDGFRVKLLHDGDVRVVFIPDR